MPALLTSTSMRPCSRATFATPSLTAASSVTSIASADARPPDCVMVAAVASAARPSRSAITTCAPSVANFRAIARPRPPAAPVTIATWFASFIVSRLHRKRDAEELLLELVEPVAQLRRLLELEVACRLDHLLLEELQLLLEVLLGHRLVLRLRLRGLELAAALIDVVDAVDDVLDALLDTPRRDPLRGVVLALLGAAPLGLVDRRAHRVGDPVAVEDCHAVDVPRGAADRLDQRSLGAQEALLVGVEHRHQRDLRDIEPLAQQVDAD